MKHLTTAIVFLGITLCVASPSGNIVNMSGDSCYIKLFEPIIDTAPFTIEAWTLMHGFGGGVYRENCLFEQRSGGTGYGAETVTILAKNAHQDEASFELRDSESGRIKLAGPIQPVAEWHHYAGVVNGEKNKILH